jgi:polar amino acid transport system substrate-binding protein
MRRQLAVSFALGVAVLVTACGAPERTASIAKPTASATTAAPATTATCSPPATASYKPSSLYSPESLPPNSTMGKIVAKKKLVVGISADSRLLGSRNLLTGQFQGIDIEMAKRVSVALFGDSKPEHLVFKTINAAQRVDLLEKRQIDMVARAMTMTCDRWKRVAFSEPYFRATQRVLVRDGSGENSLKALSDAGAKPNATKRRVCATSGSTSIQRLTAKDYPGIQPVGVSLTTDCMVLWQQGRVDAITGDDAILAGLAQQDPAAQVAGPTNVGAEPYGLAVNKADVDFVRFLNALLEQMRGNGDWQRAFAASGLQAVLKDQSQPPADFSRG